MVHVVLGVVDDQKIDAEVIDLRTLVPLDIEAVEESVKKTGRCLVVHEATRTSGFGAELAALVPERCFYHLEAPVRRLTGCDTPYPHALEWADRRSDRCGKRWSYRVDIGGRRNLKK